MVDIIVVDGMSKILTWSYYITKTTIFCGNIALGRTQKALNKW